MPQVKFLPLGTSVEVAEGTKVLVAAIRNKIPIRYGCAACQCGTCGVAIRGEGVLKPMAPAEQALLRRMHLPTDGSIRLACQSRVVSGCIEVDLSFQKTYSPDAGLLTGAAADEDEPQEA